MNRPTVIALSVGLVALAGALIYVSMKADTQVIRGTESVSEINRLAGTVNGILGELGLGGPRNVAAPSGS